MNTSDLQYTFDRLRYSWFRQRRRDRTEKLYRDLVDRLDQKTFTERLRPFWDPFAGASASKYLNLEIWLREAILRYMLVTEDLNAKGMVVDLGSGSGYFLWVCREQGHAVLGVDIPGEPLYDTCFELLDLPRVNFRIEPEAKLSNDIGDGLALITAFMTSFNRLDDGTTWGTKAWSFFLDDAREHLVAGGKLVLKFNADTRTGDLYSRDVAALFRSARAFRCRFLLDYVVLTAC